MAQPKSNALLLLYPGFNTLDVNGPLEVFKKSGTTLYFSVTVASETDITTSAEGAHMKHDIPIDDNLLASLFSYDLLIVPGGLALSATDPVQQQAKNRESLFNRLIHTFSKLPATPGRNPRVLLSICTGAILLANLGIFNAHYCTTHWGIYSLLPAYLKAGAEWATTSTSQSSQNNQYQAGMLIPARFVDAGVNANGVRIISSGGISCGIDASLHVVKRRYGEEEAGETARLLDYGWRQTEGVVFGEEF
ncbi:class I glutamine amidotransferase-like protein [Delitschia confertaspora ATCC 74209]|uniref:Class I glutamine amidotransferase-like protein n=1 Tax=Delitschia confertaspora ATCC 74209 TaxID=1513339 RepID=A0A9P4JJ02_9PLEO|nr:class I glutamine amidotransferase-like protein [Delitschia confertaspora ATCC 74209]